MTFNGIRAANSSSRSDSSGKLYPGFSLAPSSAAKASVARDAEGDTELDPGHADACPEGDQDGPACPTPRPSDYSMTDAYRRPALVAAGPQPLTIAAVPLPEHQHLTREERQAAEEEERALLRDNRIIPPRRPSEYHDGSITARVKTLLSSAGLGNLKSHGDEESAIASSQHDNQPSETSPLLGESNPPHDGRDTPDDINKIWDEAVVAGKIHTTWQREAKLLATYSRSLILTYILQYSLTMASVFTVGHIGKIELGAVSLASMTANITGYAVYQGLATSLDTLCAQAYGSGKKTLVGLQLQRMVYFLWIVTIPISIVWISGTWILEAVVPEKETAVLAGLYLKVLVAGAPGYAAFESGKRFLQAQGLFSATLYVLLICAPLNAFLNWLFVWQFGWGFIGAPIAVVVVENLLPLFLLLYVRFIDGRECWGGFERRAFKNWGPMIRLAIPGLVMVLAEYLAFEILTLSASWISTTHLAAQSVVSSVQVLMYQIPWPMAVAASTRIANLIGATLSDAAKVATKVALVAACLVGLLNAALLGSLRYHIPRLFTGDEDVIALVASVLPVIAALQLFDALGANLDGILRGLGRQEVGGYVNLFVYYVIAMPVSFGTCFGLHWGLHGLWVGPAVGLGLISSIKGLFIYKTSWERAVQEAHKRNIRG